MRVLVIHGPNMNLLGKRDNSIYGNNSIDKVNNLIIEKANKVGIEVEVFHSNHEGEIIDKLQNTIDSKIDGIIINPGAYTHYSIGIRDAIEILNIPIIEVHLSNINSREDFRRKSVIAPVCNGQISGLGVYSYLLALEALSMMKNNFKEVEK